MTRRLLAEDEPDAVTVHRPAGRSPFFLTCDHAANRIPRALGSLGLDRRELERHIAWDIGAEGVSQHLSAALDATLVVQNYSRLVIDCNRPHGHDGLIPSHSEDTTIPGNHDVDDVERRRRREEIFEPYHAAITDLLDRRAARTTAYIAVHSFTPVYLERERPWHIGILYGSDPRMAAPVLGHLRGGSGITVGDNEPYRIDDKDFGIPEHGERRGIPHVLVEIRQDLIANADGQREWAARLLGPLQDALASVVGR